MEVLEHMWRSFDHVEVLEHIGGYTTRHCHWTSIMLIHSHSMWSLSSHIFYVHLVAVVDKIRSEMIFAWYNTSVYHY